MIESLARVVVTEKKASNGGIFLKETTVSLNLGIKIPTNWFTMIGAFLVILYITVIALPALSIHTARNPVII